MPRKARIWCRSTSATPSSAPRGLPPRTFVCRVSIATGEKAPRLRLSIINLEQHQQEMAQEAVDQITEALGNDMPVYIGCYAKG